mmetsp:Transcript_3379/g.9409  ORF Transcript_3379/g.9409 Transcript_3379/m.9409 type:complete len:285 (-) Transcript_3379:11-865(-)
MNGTGNCSACVFVLGLYWIGGLELVALVSSKFLPRDDTISVLVLALPQPIGNADSLLGLEPGLDFLLGQFLVFVAVDFLKDVGRRWCTVKNVNDLDVKLQCGATGNICSGAALSVAHLGGDGENGLGALAQIQESLVPSWDDLAHSNLEGKCLIPVVGRVKFLSLLTGVTAFVDGPSVVHNQVLSSHDLFFIGTLGGSVVDFHVHSSRGFLLRLFRRGKGREKQESCCSSKLHVGSDGSVLDAMYRRSRCYYVCSLWDFQSIKKSSATYGMYQNNDETLFHTVR